MSTNADQVNKVIDNVSEKAGNIYDTVALKIEEAVGILAQKTWNSN